MITHDRETECDSGSGEARSLSVRDHDSATDSC
jgi:hypothetical protein